MCICVYYLHKEVDENQRRTKKKKATVVLEYCIPTLSPHRGEDATITLLIFVLSLLLSWF